MNLLQGIPESDPLFVTLNPADDIPDELIYDDVQFAHPLFDGAAIRAQTMIQTMQGANHTWFAGAYNRHGFHEDGIASAMRVIRALNAPELLKGDRYEIYGQGAEISIPVGV
jgi:predicted NAD/FAD-binding protein